jgi:beta-glucosidase
MDNTRREFLSLAALAAAGLRAAPPAPRLSSYDSEAKKILAGLSLDQKIGQMTQPDQQYLESIDDIETYHLGSLLSGGDSDPKSGNDVASWTAMYERLQKRALASKLRIPLLYGVDSVHGHSNVVGAVIFPHNIGLGCTRSEKLVEEVSRITAVETRATGVNWAFAPCVTVPQDIRWGRTYEGFSEDPKVVAPLGAAATRGLQHGGLGNPLAVLACVKHFAGDGGTAFGTGMIKDKKTGERFPLDRGDTAGNEDELFKLHIAGYIPSIQAGAGSIMPSYSSWNGEKASGSKKLMTTILKQKLGFEGFLISDYNALDELPGSTKEQIALSINAGMDMVMVPERYKQFFKLLRANVDEGKVPLSRIDDAVLRILRVKLAMRLMSPDTNVLAIPSAQKTFGSAEHRAVARQAVRESVVVLKNDKRVLPVARSAKRIHVAGKNMDDIGSQCGGWTITWQGNSGAITKGTTILAAIRKGVSAGASITTSPNGTGAEGAAVAIAVIGEKPYAEMTGDRKELRLPDEDIAVVKNLKRAGVPVIAVLISGRPLVIDEILNDADAIVAAWWPGTEGDGVADVLFGAHKPSGKLSYTWPSGASTSFRRGDSGYKVLYPFGHGL